MYPSGRGSFVGRDRFELPVRTWKPEREVRAVMLALHGFNDYSNAFSRPAERMSEHGIQTYAYDQRGFGQGPHAGQWFGTAALAADCRDMLRLVAARHPGRPVYLLGESMGAAVAIVAAAGDPGQQPPLAGVILSAPALWDRASMPALYRTVLAAANDAAPWYPLTGEGLRIQATDNLEALRELVRDPFVLKRTRVGAIHGLADLMDSASAAISDLRPPALLLYGLKDQVTPAKPTLRAAERLSDRPNGVQRVAVYDDGYHLLLRDLRGDRVAADIVAWIADPAAALPSGGDRMSLARLRDRAGGDPAAAGRERFAPQ